MSVKPAGASSSLRDKVAFQVRIRGSSSLQPIEPDCVVVEEFALLVGRAVADDRFQGFDPLAVGGRESADGPVAAEHDAVGAEGLQRVVDGGCQVVGGPFLGTGAR